MRQFSTATIVFFVLAFANIFLFFAFQFFVSKKFVLADQDDLTRILTEYQQESSEVQALTRDVSHSLQQANDVQKQVVATIENNKDAVVSIIVTKNLQFFLQDPRSLGSQARIAERKTEIGGGSGIIVRKNGLILTNKHVVSDLEAEYTVVLNDGETYEVANIWRDPVIDIAMIQLAIPSGENMDLPVAHFVDFSSPVYIGQFVIAIGNALAEYQNSVTLGILSAKNRMLESYDSDSLYIGLYQTDTSINPGNSGGPLFDINGKVLGVTTAINANGDGIGFALPVTREFVDASIKLIETYNYLERPFIGIQYKDLTALDIKELGVSVEAGTLIEDVLPNSAAAEYGLQPGDIITTIDGHPVMQDMPFMYHIYQHVPGDTVLLSVVRDNKNLDISLVLGKK